MIEGLPSSRPLKIKDEEAISFGTNPLLLNWQRLKVNIISWRDFQMHFAEGFLLPVERPEMWVLDTIRTQLSERCYLPTSAVIRSSTTWHFKIVLLLWPKCFSVILADDNGNGFLDQIGEIILSSVLVMYVRDSRFKFNDLGQSCLHFYCQFTFLF